MSMKEGWKCVLEEDGVQSVMMDGGDLTLVWHVDSWDSVLKVNYGLLVCLITAF